MKAPFWAWAATSAFLGLGFTFFSGAVQAWLVDALTDAKYFDDGGQLDTVLAKGEIAEGSAMLIGSVGGGVIAQATNLGVPYLLRAVVLGLTFGFAFFLMRDEGFTPSRGKHPLQEVKRVLRDSIKDGLGHPPVRWVMLESLFSGGVLIYAFYAMQPYLLELYGDERAYAVAGLAAAIVAGAQIIGGLIVPQLARVFRRRTTVLLVGTAASTVMLALIGLIPNFWVAVTLLVFWGLMYSAIVPVRQSYLNAQIPSKARATVLSFDSLLGSTGAAVTQPLLGKAADVWSYPASYIATAALQLTALPFLWMARQCCAVSADILRAEDSKKSTDRTN